MWQIIMHGVWLRPASDLAPDISQSSPHVQMTFILRVDTGRQLFHSVTTTLYALHLDRRMTFVEHRCETYSAAPYDNLCWQLSGARVMRPVEALAAQNPRILKVHSRRLNHSSAQGMRYSK
jgi:hypothetical protein